MRINSINKKSYMNKLLFILLLIVPLGWSEIVYANLDGTIWVNTEHTIYLGFDNGAAYTSPDGSDWIRVKIFRDNGFRFVLWEVVPGEEVSINGWAHMSGNYSIPEGSMTANILGGTFYFIIPIFKYMPNVHFNLQSTSWTVPEISSF